jgi:ATP-dependent exoDNAse (exonuclease V) beta subunit
MADHPGDRISRYLVARTLLGEVVGLGPEDWMSEVRSEEVARKVRRRLVEEGYGSVLREWTGALAPYLLERDARRMRQMVELGYRWEGRASLRATDFVRMVEKVRMEDPASAEVRVMTVHRAKGLEFDAVILPDLDALSLSGEGRDPFLPLRDEVDGSVVAVFPAIPAPLRPLFFGEIPEVAAAFPGVDFERVARASGQARERVLRDGLSALYVGVTRPRYSLLLLVGAEGEKRKKEKSGGKRIVRTAGELLRNALAGESTAGGEESEGDILYERGSPEWWKDPALPDSIRGGRVTSSPPGRAAGRVVLAASPRGRLLPVRSPSELEGEGRVSLERLLLAGVGREEGALRRGTLTHAWLAAIEWLESTGVPSNERLLAIAGEEAPEITDVSKEKAVFEGWLTHPEIRRLLSRESFPPGTRVERERPFLARDGERILRGIADRLLRIPDSDGDRLLIIDWKSDRLEPSGSFSLEVRTDFYAPQVRAYMRGLAASEGIPLTRVEGALVFLGSGTVVRIENP